MMWFTAFLAVMTAQSIAAADDVIDCKDCNGRIRTKLNKFLNSNHVIEIPLLETSTAEITLTPGQISEVKSNVCPGTNSSYKLEVLIHHALLEVNVKTTFPQIVNEIRNVYSTLVNMTKLPCQNGATVRNFSNIFTFPELDLAKCNMNVPSTPPNNNEVKLEFSSDLKPIKLILSVDVTADKQTRITDLEYKGDPPPFRTTVDNECNLKSGQALNDACECILNIVFQKSFLERVIPSLFACYMNDDVFKEPRDVFNCIS